MVDVCLLACLSSVEAESESESAQHLAHAWGSSTCSPSDPVSNRNGVAPGRDHQELVKPLLEEQVSLEVPPSCGRGLLGV